MRMIFCVPDYIAQTYPLIDKTSDKFAFYIWKKDNKEIVYRNSDIDQ